MNYFVRMKQKEAKLLKTHFQSGNQRVIEDRFVSLRCIQVPIFFVFDIKNHFEFRVGSRFFQITVFLWISQFKTSDFK